MTKYGIGASVLRKEDDRFLRGRGQYVADYRIAGMREVAFVRSPVAHARLKRIHVPDRIPRCRFHRQRFDRRETDRLGAAAQGLQVFGRADPGGRQAALCRRNGRDVPGADPRAKPRISPAPSRSEFDELPAVTDMLAACQPGSPLVHEEWGDNIFVEFSENGADRGGRQERGDQGHARPSAPRAIACFRWKGAASSPIAIRGCATSRSSPRRSFRIRCRPDYANVSGSSTAASASFRPTSAAASATRGCCAGKRSRSAGWRRKSIIRCAGWRIAASISRPTPIAASIIIEITGYATAEGKLLGDRLRRPCRCRRLFVLPDFLGAGGGADRQSVARTLRLFGLPMPLLCGRHQQMSDHALSRRRPFRRLPRDRSDHGRDRARGRARTLRGPAAQHGAARSRCRSTMWSASISTAAIIRNACAAPSRRSGLADIRQRQKQPGARRTPDRRRAFILRRAGRARHLRARRLGPADRARLRAGQRQAHRRRRGRNSRRHPFARAGA